MLRNTKNTNSLKNLQIVWRTQKIPNIGNPAAYAFGKIACCTRLALFVF